MNNVNIMPGRTERKLSDHGYYPDLDRTGSFNVSKKVCRNVFYVWIFSQTIFINFSYAC